MYKIKAKMAEAISNGHEVWIVTANWTYKKDDMKKLFAPDSDNLLGKIKFYNGIDIGQELNIPRDQLHTIHSKGKKAEFLSKVIMGNDDLKNYKVNCVLFDDTQSQKTTFLSTHVGRGDFQVLTHGKVIFFLIKFIPLLLGKIYLPISTK